MQRIQQFRQYLTVKGLSTRTIFVRIYDTKQFLKFIKGKRFSLPLIKKYIYHLIENKKYAPTSVNHNIHSLRVYVKWRYPEGVYQRRLLKALQTIKEPKKLPIIPSVEEVLQILNSPRVINSKMQHNKKAYIHFQLAIELLIKTGMRRNELCSLDIKDLYFNHETPHIHIRLGKGGLERKIPIPHDMIDKLKEFTKDRDGALFLNCRETRITGQQLCLEFKKRGRYSPHKFRHFFLTDLLRHREPLAQVARVAGHTGTRTLMEVYQHLVVDDLKDTVNAFSLTQAPKKEDEKTQKIVIIEKHIIEERPISQILPDKAIPKAH